MSKMLNIIKKDILTVERGIIVQCCNTIGVVGGLARAIADKYPKNLKIYKQVLNKGADLGETILVKITNDLYIANLLTQSEIGTYKVQTNLDALKSSLEEVQLIKINFNLPVYIPYFLGSGLAGGPTQQTKQETWAKVSELIISILPKATICKLS